MNTRLPTIRNKRKVFILAAMGLLLAMLAWYVNKHVSLEELVIQEDRIRAAIVLHPWRSFVIGFGIYAVLSLLPGTGGKTIVAGWLFGYWQGMIIVMVGLTAAAMVIFSLSRYLFRAHIERRYTRFLSLMNRHIEREGAFYLLTLRMAHAPFSIINPVSGASRIRAWTFFWTTMLGLLPGTAVWAYVGVRLPSLSDLASNGPGSLLDPPLIFALAASATMPLIFRWLVSRFGIPFSTGPQCDANTEKTVRPKP